MSPLSLGFIAVLVFCFHLSCVIGAPIDNHVGDGNLTVVYQLFTRRNPSKYQILELDDLERLSKSNYDPKLLVKVYAAGWGNDGSIAYPTKDEYLLREDCNFIVVDWFSLQIPVLVPEEGRHIITEAGQQTGAFIEFLINDGTPLSAFHLIGHSVGTHLVGKASTSIAHGKVPRITGLEPVKGLWTLNDTDERLDITDADFVDIIHTNSGELYKLEVSFFEAIGHVDFYVNGGHKQPGCKPLDHVCHHCRAVDLYAESVNSKLGFRSLKCDSFVDFQKGLCDGNDSQLMGEPTPLSARGVYQLTTNKQAPFARG